MPAPLSEAEFLHLLAPTGLDWKTPLSTFVTRHGITKPYGWQEVVQLPPSPGLSTEPLSWSILLHKAALDLPPGYLSAEAWPFAEAERNLEAAASWLRPALGLGEPHDTSNTRGVCWRVGAFTVRLTVWPPQLQSPPRLPNALHEAEPRLATAAHLVLESTLAHLEPDESLLPLIGAVDTFDISAGARFHELGQQRLEPNYRYSRRLPAQLRAVWPETGCRAWVLGDRWGLAGQGLALVLPRIGATLVLDRALPARAPGHSALYAQVSGGNVTLLRGPRPESLAATAKALSRFCAMPMRVDEYEAD